MEYGETDYLDNSLSAQIRDAKAIRKSLRAQLARTHKMKCELRKIQAQNERLRLACRRENVSCGFNS